MMTELPPPTSKAEWQGLHLGCGKHVLEGWVNADLQPDPSRGIVKLDAREPFPFADAGFDYVFSEHMIEHVPYADGVRMIHECFRVLRPGGKIRIATPDFRFLVNLYLGSLRGERERYVRWATDHFIPWADGYDPLFVINNFVRCWGHQFIYDEEVLARVLESCSFAEVRRWKVGESNAPVLQNVENPNRMSEQFLELESVILEGYKKP